jgi:hypothetical protein
VVEPRITEDKRRENAGPQVQFNLK